MYTYIHSQHAVYSVEFTAYSVIRLLPGAICVCACGCRIFSPDWPSFNTTAIQGFRSVCLCLWHRWWSDTAATRKIAATFRTFLSVLHFYRFQCFIHTSQSLCLPRFPSLRLSGHSSLPPRRLQVPLSLFFRVPFHLLPPSVPLHQTRSLTQYRIDWFCSVLSDLAVIVPERSRQIDFSEKDTVMFGNLLLHRAN